MSFLETDQDGYVFVMKMYKITKYYRRVALRIFHLYENVGVEQILRSSQINVRKLLDLKQFEYEQLIEVMRFAGAQT